MQRFIVVRVFHSLIALVAISIIVFGLARITGNPLDVLLPIEATQEDFDRVERAWGLDKPLPLQYFKYVSNILQGDFRRLLQVAGQNCQGVGGKSLSRPPCNWRRWR